MFGFTAFDVGVAIIVAISLFTGFSRGFTREAFTLFAWAGAVFATVFVLPYTATWAAAVLPWEAVADLTAMVLTFLVALWILSAIGKRLSENIKTSFIGPLDRGLGTLFGLIRGAFIVSIGYMALTLFMPEKDGWQWVEKARLRSAAATGAEFVSGLAPDLFAAAKKAVKKAKDVDGEEILSDLKGLLPSEETKKKAAGYTDRARQELDQLIGKAADEAAGS